MIYDPLSRYLWIHARPTRPALTEGQAESLVMLAGCLMGIVIIVVACAVMHLIGAW